MKIIKFTKPLDGYRVDDCASFEDTAADRVIAAEYGVEIKLEDTKAVDSNAKKVGGVNAINNYTKM